MTTDGSHLDLEAIRRGIYTQRYPGNRPVRHELCAMGTYGRGGWRQCERTAKERRERWSLCPEHAARWDRMHGRSA